jgi:protein-S-isoprenylcysteine O-methyltransferase Ste14
MTPCVRNGGDAVSPGAVIYLLWGLWFIAWLVGAAMARREPGTLHGRLSFLFHLIAAAAALFLLMLVRPWPATDLQYRLWASGVPDGLGWVLVVFALASFGFSGWASAHRITCLKHGARLVDSGPYAVVRHPIYLGLIVAAVMTATLFGQPTSLLGAVLLVAALAAKVHLEERVMTDATHHAYRSRVPMFVPFWPTRDADKTPHNLLR